jgi:hypothetical protein
MQLKILHKSLQQSVHRIIALLRRPRVHLFCFVSFSTLVKLLSQTIVPTHWHCHQIQLQDETVEYEL